MVCGSVLAESWRNGNRSYVIDSLAELPAGEAAAASASITLSLVIDDCRGEAGVFASALVCELVDVQKNA